MKKLILMMAFYILNGMFLNAHNLNNEMLALRQWHLKGSTKSVEGAFLMCKNNAVYIENNAHQVLHFPMDNLSVDDLNFVTQKQNAILKLNRALSAERKQTQQGLVWSDMRGLFLAMLILVIGFVLYRSINREKIKYMFPILASGVLFSLYSFTNRVMQVMATTTDPLFVDSAFTQFKPNVYTRWDNTYFYVESKGIPSHEMMTGITGWQQQFPIPQCYTGTNAWQIPLNPVKAVTPVPVNQKHFLRGAVAIAANGVAIFNPYTNTGVDAFLDGQLDNFGGHCGRADDYHYHIAPMFLDAATPDIVPIAFALDGYAIYGSKEPDGSAMKTLDANHGHAGANGVYHYHGTATAPYMIGNMVGVVTEDTTLQIIPQAHAQPIRPAGTPLKGAVITGCKPNGAGNGYTLVYTLAGVTDSVEYSWTAAGVYTFNFYVSGTKTTNKYNGFKECNLPLSVPQIGSDALGVLMYPNPANTQLNLKLTATLSAKAIENITIYNATGAMVYSTLGFKETIDIKTLATGVYMVKIKTKDQVITKKLMVN